MSSRESFYRGSRDRYASTYRLRSINRCGWGDETQQTHAYAAMLESIHSDGTILDLGCGDGMLLHYILAHSPFHHIPYGIDFLEESIDQAKAAVLPEFADNFRVGNVADLDWPRPTFRFVIACPDHVQPGDQADFVMNLTSRIEAGGRLVLYEYAGSTAFRSFESRITSLAPGRRSLRTTAWVKLLIFDR